MQVRARQYQDRLQPPPALASPGAAAASDDDMDIASPVPAAAPALLPQQPGASQGGGQSPEPLACADSQTESGHLRAVQCDLAAAVERRDHVRLGRVDSSASPESSDSRGAAELPPHAQPAALQPIGAAAGAIMSQPCANPAQQPVMLGPSLGAAAQPAAPDGNVTLATQVAFAAINDMFADGSLEEPAPSAGMVHQLHAPSGAGGITKVEHAAAAASMAPRMPSGDVTIATRSAFDAVNSMFAGALPHDAPWPADASQNRQDAHSSARVSAGAGEVTQRLLRGSMHPSRGVPAAAEPTVTISTKAAFDALNEMFATRLPHEATSRVVPLREPAACEPEPAATGFEIYEDTQFITGRLPREDLAAKTMAIYEDTQFLTGNIAAAAAGAGSSPGSPVAGLALQASSPEPLQLYEDTQFMRENVVPRGPPTAAEDAGMQLYEDTQFMSENAVPHGDAGVQPYAGRQPLAPRQERRGLRPVAATGAEPSDPIAHALGSAAELLADIRYIPDDNQACLTCK